MKRDKMRDLGSALLATTAVITLALLGVMTMEAAPAQQQNLLQNPGFEQPFSNGVAAGWQTWHRDDGNKADGCESGYHFRPKWNVETGGGLVNEGLSSQYIGNNWDTWSGGVYQTVDAVPGQTYRFTFFGRGRGSNEEAPEPSEFGLNFNMRAGIDPNGSGNWADGDVVWSGTASPHDQWQQFTVEATATGDRLTVFTYADWGVVGANQCRQYQDTWYDNASLVAAGAPPTNTPPPAPQATATLPPTATPEEVAEVEPTAEPTAVPTEAPTGVPGGRICVNAFNDENANGAQEANEGYIAGVTFTVANDVAIVGQAVSTGSEEPRCFEGVEPGEYQVAQTLPSRLEPTTASNATVIVEEGKTVGLAFGSRLRLEQGQPGAGPNEPQATAESGATTTPGDETAAGSGTNFVTVASLIAIVLVVVVLGAVLFWLLRR